MHKSIACLVFAFGLLSAFASAQEAQPTPLPQGPPSPPPFTSAMAHAIDAIARDEVRSGTTPAISVGVVEDGLLVYAHGFGYASLRPRRLAAAGTQFYAGSIAKQLTAASVLLLAQQKKLALTDQVTKYVPELTVAKGVTIAQLLNQTSGLPDYTQAPGIPHDPSQPVKMEALIAAVDKMQPAAPPGLAVQYNNFNYTIAGLIVQRVAGVPLSLFYQTQIFEPLIMTSTFVAGDQGISPSHADPYTRIDQRFVATKAWDPSWLFGSSGLVTNVYDLAKWDIGMPLLLNVDSVRSMWSASSAKGLPYGMGWVIDQRGGQRFVWHNGEVAGYHAMNALLPDQHIAVIVLANCDGLHDPAVEPERVANRILDVVAPVPPAHFANVVVTRATEWLGRLANVQIDRTQLTPDFSTYLSDQVVERADFKSLGAALSIVPVESFERSGDTVYVFSVKFRQGTFRYQFALTPDGKIDGLFLQP